MSDFHCEVVEVKNVGRHPNADTLSIADANGNPVIFRTGDYKDGDLAVYVPVDAIVPDTEEWSFLGGHRRIRAKRLRGVFSMGLLTSVRPGMELGQDVMVEMGIEKYEPENFAHRGGKGGRVMPGDSEPDPGFLPEYTDIEGYRRWKTILEPGEEVVLTEKIHGANARFVYRDDRLWVGSRKQIKRKPGTHDPSQWFAIFTTQRPDGSAHEGKCGPLPNQERADEFLANLRNVTTVLAGEVRHAQPDDYEPSEWWKVAERLGLEERLSLVGGFALYGEIYGQVQDLKYGQSGIELVLFDALDTYTRSYVDYDHFKTLATLVQLPTVPELYRGPWSEDLLSLAEGKTTLSGDHVREGFVVRPVKERYHAGYPNDAGHLRGGLGRVILKHVGEAYLTRKGG